MGDSEYKYSGPELRELVWAQKEPWTQTSEWKNRPLRCRVHLFHSFKYTAEGKNRRCVLCSRKEVLHNGTDSYWAIDFSPVDYRILNGTDSPRG